MPQSITASGVTTTFVYDGSGMRVKKIRPSATTVYIGKLYECVAGACSKYIFAGGTRIAHKASDTVYFTQDHLGSTRVVTDANGNKSEDIYYYPFGGAQSDSGAVSMTYKYTAQEFDAETGLYNYNARLYNPSLGRFISPDTIVPDPSNPQAFNRYSYVINNPMIYTDPTGHDIWSDISDEASRDEQRVRNQANRTDQERRYYAREGVAGVTYNVNREIERHCGSTNDLCEALEYTLDAAVAPAVYAGLAVTSPDKALTDPAWRIGNGMAATNLSAPGQSVNFGVTALSGTPRLAKPTKYAGKYPMVLNSMFGGWGGGFTPGPVSFISPGSSNDPDTLMHESGHQMQYDSWGGSEFLLRAVPQYRIQHHGIRQSGGAGTDGAFEWDADYRACHYYNVPVYGGYNPPLPPNGGCR